MAPAHFLRTRVRADLVLPFKYVGYCDESDDTSLVLTCMFARASDWALIVRSWQAILAEHEIEEFHAKHSEQRKRFWWSWADPTELLAALGACRLHLADRLIGRGEEMERRQGRAVREHRGGKRE